MKRSINLADMTKLKQAYPIICDYMVAPLLTRETIEHDKTRLDEVAVLVRDDVPDEQWDAVKTILRNGMGLFPGYHRNHLRIYEGHKRV
jgi:hypothetical protein